MSHWFHRNPLKATGLQNFEIKMFAHDSDALKVRTMSPFEMHLTSIV